MVPGTRCCWDRPDHFGFGRTEEGLRSFGLKKPLSVESLMGCWESLQDKAESHADGGGLACEFAEGSRLYQSHPSDVMDGNFVELKALLSWDG